MGCRASSTINKLPHRDNATSSIQRISNPDKPNTPPGPAVPLSPRLPPRFLGYARGNGHFQSFTIPQSLPINHHPRKRGVRDVVLEQFGLVHRAITRVPLLDPRPLVALWMVKQLVSPKRRRIVRRVVEHSHAHTWMNILRRVHLGGFVP
jgi:hypothetical protein